MNILEVFAISDTTDVYFTKVDQCFSVVCEIVK